MRATYITAIVIAIAIVAWLLSGTLNQDDKAQSATIAEQNRENQRIQEDSSPTKVRVAVLQASEQQQVVKVRGKTANKRTVDVKVELSGRIVARPVERGTAVNEGDVLCKISTEDRAASLTEARESLNQARLEYKGALSLQARGFNSETAIAAAKARLAAVEATLNRRQLDLAKLVVRAPFSGLIEDVQLEIGDFVTPGANCATIVDMDPMLLVGRISEQDVVALKLDQPAQGLLRDGRVVSGPVSFIGQQSDPNTRTYPIEIQLPNPDRTLRSGITAEIIIPVAQVLAQKVSPALLALDDTGDIGIRTINEDNIVEFHNVEILSDASDGVWVTGLPVRAAVITVGQELVSPGERVDPVFLGGKNMPAQTDAQPESSSTVDADPNAAALGLQTTLNSPAS
jgi:multidrug efflux system membrane fusion protein